MPDRDSVRVEEMINYFPYDWPAPETAATPFRPTVTVMPTPWNAGTLLMHVAIKGYELPATEKPRSNLVFLIDTSGSMHDADKLPLVKASLKLLLDRLSPEDTVGLVTYAGIGWRGAGTDQGSRSGQRSSRRSTGSAPAARRRALPASRRPTGLPKRPSSRAALTA